MLTDPVGSLDDCFDVAWQAQAQKFGQSPDLSRCEEKLRRSIRIGRADRRDGWSSEATAKHVPTLCERLGTPRRQLVRRHADELRQAAPTEAAGASTRPPSQVEDTV